jgi:hypothetical protein
VALRRCGSSEVWLFGGVALRRCGSSEVWLFGGVALRRCGSSEVWLFGGRKRKGRLVVPAFALECSSVLWVNAFQEVHGGTHWHNTYDFPHFAPIWRDFKPLGLRQSLFCESLDNTLSVLSFR